MSWFEMDSLSSSGSWCVKHHVDAIQHSNGEYVNDLDKLQLIRCGIPRFDRVRFHSLERCIALMQFGDTNRISSNGF